MTYDVSDLIIRCDCGRILAVWENVNGFAVPIPVVMVQGELHKVQWTPTKKLQGICACGRHFARSGHVTDYDELIKRLSERTG